ncbi:MAG TPA: porin family protein [Xanthomonadales bacterium]|nr:porin family protein [Xanthomonadales bacterium]
MFFSNLNYFRMVIGSLLLLLPFCWAAAAGQDNPWYVEAAVGYSDFSANLSGFELYDTDTGWSLGFGYAFNPYISVQVGYHNLADDYRVDDCPRNYICLVENVDLVDMTGVSASALFNWPISETFDVFGQVGVISWDADFETLNHDASDEDFMYGAGLGVNFSDHWRMVAKHERFDFDASTTSMGLIYKF